MGLSKWLVKVLSVLLCAFTILFVNFNVLLPQSALALFAMFGLVLCFLSTPAWKKTPPTEVAGQIAEPTAVSWWIRFDRASSWLAALLSVVCFGYIFVQTEPVFSQFWPESSIFTRPVSLPERSGDETSLDYWIGLMGLALVLEATRRTIGWIVPALAILFVLHSYFAPQLPDWLLPHQGQTPKQIVSVTFLQSLGVLGPATSVMFKFVFLFVVFGAFLEMSGATQFIIDFSQKMFHNSVGGAAKISVLSSGLMGSLSGSAVANAVTTGTFTIPMMRTSGFRSHEAAAVEAAAGSGGAMMPPVMGAAAYMMLEFVENLTFLEVVKAALIPAILYYLSLFFIVHYTAKRRIAEGVTQTAYAAKAISVYEGVIFFGALAFLVVLLIAGFSPFKAVTGSLILITVLSLFRGSLQVSSAARWMALGAFLLAAVVHQGTYALQDTALGRHDFVRAFLATGWYHPDGFLSWRLAFESLLSSGIFGVLGMMAFGLWHAAWREPLLKALKSAAFNGIPLIAASACVGIIIGIVQSTPMANDFSAAIKSVIDGTPVVGWFIDLEQAPGWVLNWVKELNLFIALCGIMACSIVLGMGVPSVVCYLLMATLMGSLLGELGVPALAAHMFIFYYGMMSMVTPPVALAAYAAASLAQAPIMKTSFTAFRYSLVGFALPFMFIYQPALLLLSRPENSLDWADVAMAVVSAGLGVYALSLAVTGYFRSQLSTLARLGLVLAAVLLLWPSIGGFMVGLAINLVGFGLLAGVLATSKKRLIEIRS